MARSTFLQLRIVWLSEIQHFIHESFTITFLNALSWIWVVKITSELGFLFLPAHPQSNFCYQILFKTATTGLVLQSLLCQCLASLSKTGPLQEAHEMICLLAIISLSKNLLRATTFLRLCLLQSFPPLPHTNEHHTVSLGSEYRLFLQQDTEWKKCAGAEQ